MQTSLPDLPFPNYGDVILLLLGLCLIAVTEYLLLGFRRLPDLPFLMQTSLPDLPFPHYGDAVFETYGPHGSAKAGPRKHPRTDLETLVPWTSFLNDIHQAILAITCAPTTPFHINGSFENTIVQNEFMIYVHTVPTLLRPAANVLRRLGVNGCFVMPGGGNNAIVLRRSRFLMDHI
jgi:hypothetical protein